LFSPAYPVKQGQRAGGEDDDIIALHRFTPHSSRKRWEIAMFGVIGRIGRLRAMRAAVIDGLAALCARSNRGDQSLASVDNDAGFSVSPSLSSPNYLNAALKQNGLTHADGAARMGRKNRCANSKYSCSLPG
jgi:hypothetical protein